MRMPGIGSLITTIRLPSPQAIVQDIVDWGRNEGLWWATSVLAHAVVLSTVLLLMGSIVSPPIQNEAPKFDSAVNTEVAEPPMEHFQTGEVPLDTTELTTETLTLTEAP